MACTAVWAGGRPRPCMRTMRRLLHVKAVRSDQLVVLAHVIKAVEAQMCHKRTPGVVPSGRGQALNRHHPLVCTH